MEFSVILIYHCGIFCLHHKWQEMCNLYRNDRLGEFPVLLLHKMDLLAFTYQFELTNPSQHPYILQDSYEGRDQMTSDSLELFK